MINKFHGDPELFSMKARPSSKALTGTPCLGIVPHFAGAAHFPPKMQWLWKKRWQDGSVETHQLRFCACRALPISMISIPAAGARRLGSASSSRASPSRPMPTSSSFRAPNRPWPIWRRCAREGWDIDLWRPCPPRRPCPRPVRRLPDAGPANPRSAGSGRSRPAMQGLGLLDVETTLVRTRR